MLTTGPGAESITLIAAQQIEYRAPIPFHRDPLDVEVWISRMGGASLQVCYELYSPVGIEPRTLYTLASSTIVLVDRASGAPRRISAQEREAWEPYVEAPVQFRQQ